MVLKHRIFVLLILLFAVQTFAQNSEPAIDAESYGRAVTQISAGAAPKERGAAIREELERLEVKYSYEPFTAKARNGADVKGWNIIAELPNPKAIKTLLLGAHYDRVARGSGAVDNASGSAAILQLLKAFKQKPLQNYALKVAFWDKEEVGLVGSREFIRNRGESDLPAMYINFDVFGYGDTLWLWTKDEKAGFAGALKDAAQKTKVKAIVGRDYPPSDHLSFAETKVQTFSFSLATENEINGIVGVLKGQQIKPEEFPRVLQIIHTDSDTVDKIDAKSVAAALIAVEQAIRGIDK